MVKILIVEDNFIAVGTAENGTSAYSMLDNGLD